MASPRGGLLQSWQPPPPLLGSMVSCRATRRPAFVDDLLAAKNPDSPAMIRAREGRW